ncbi:MAG TPA: hypothetical protein VFP21_00275 [Solirubrobacterales bacterium]|nr:hypothetical protein [Solirubrobacterales bacterium]
MSILDDAIREHLELKRAHGADEAELKRLEDEAFGPPGRPEEPDPFAEAPTEFMAQPGTAGAGEADEGGRRINIADLQEPPPPERAEQGEEPRVEAVESIEQPDAEAAPTAPAEDPAQAAPPDEEPSAMEHEIVAEPAEAEAPADERQELAEQPTEFFDVEAEMGAEDAPAPPTEAPSPSDEEIVVAEQREEPRLVPVADEEDEEDEEFWSEQRLSDELDQALEAPVADEPSASAPEGGEDEADEQPRADYDPDTGHEDVLEDTPEFLEDAPEDDDLWFEQKPPKDFDFDD